MDIQQHNKYRHAVIELAKEGQSFPQVADNTLACLKEVQQRQEDIRFRLVLLGNFQGGKSTTFNALCGGREISPRGNMLKTSACSILATGVESRQEEKAIISFKTLEELYLSVWDVVAPYLTTEEAALYSLNQEGDFNLIGRKFLTKGVEHSFLCEKLNLAWQDYVSDLKKARKVSSAEEREELPKRYDMLRIATIILHFAEEFLTEHGDEDKHCNLDEVASYVKFPIHFSELGGMDAIHKFTYKEMLFAFVRKVFCFVQSAWLNESRCTIVDCPGLGASSYDSKIARETLSEAHAVVYLFGGDKAAKDDQDATQVKEFHSQGLMKGRPWLFVLNTKQAKGTTDALINERNNFLHEKIDSEKSVISYHALLFFLAQFGKSQLSGGLSSSDADRFISLAETMYGEETLKESFPRYREGQWTEIWGVISNTALSQKGIIGKPVSFDKEGFDYCLEKSDHQSLFDSCQKEILDKQSETQLIDCGTKDLRSIFCDAKETAKAAIDSANKGEEARQESYALSHQFVEKYKEAFSQSLEKNVYKDQVFTGVLRECAVRLSNSDTVYALSFDLAKVIRSNSSFFDDIKKMAKGAWNNNSSIRHELQKKYEPIIAPVVKRHMEGIVAGIIADFKNREIDGYDAVYLAIQKTDEEISCFWDQYKASYPQTLVGVIPTSLESMFKTLELNVDDGGKELKKGMGGSIVLGVSESMMITMKEIISKIVGVIITAVVLIVTAVIIDVCFCFGLGTMLSGLGFAIVKGYSFLFSSEEEEQRREEENEYKQATKVAEKLYHGGGNGKKDGLKDILSYEKLISFSKDSVSDDSVSKLLPSFRKAFIDILKSLEDLMKKEVKSDVEARIQEDEKQHALSLDEKEHFIKSQRELMRIVDQLTQKTVDLEKEITPHLVKNQTETH